MDEWSEERAMCEQCGGRCCQADDEQAAGFESANARVQPKFAEANAPDQVQRAMNDLLNGSPHQRRAALLQLQRQHGNQAVRRLLDSNVPPNQIQRWQVNIPADTACADVAGLITDTSPYSPNWARAHFEFPWSSSYRARGTAPDYTLEPINMRVRVTPNIDVPRWSPSERGTRTAWNTAMTNLNAHEELHRQIATTWRGNIQTAMEAYRPTVTADNEAGAVAQGEAEFQAEHDRQLVLHQAAQDALDTGGINCVAIINCPAPATSQNEEGDSDTAAG